MIAKRPAEGPGLGGGKSRLLKLLGPLSLSLLVSAGCASDPDASSSEPAGPTPGAEPASEHACGSGCGATGCGGPKKTSEKTSKDDS